METAIKAEREVLVAKIKLENGQAEFVSPLNGFPFTTIIWI